MHTKFAMLLLGLIWATLTQATNLNIEAKLIYNSNEKDQYTVQKWSPYNNLNQKFNHFTIVEINTAVFYNQLKNLDQPIDISFNIGNQFIWDINFLAHPIFASNFQYTRQISSNQKKSTDHKPDLVSLRGYANQQSQLSTLTISNDNLMGKIVINNKAYFIESAKHYLSEISTYTYIVYEETDVVDVNHPQICGNQEEAPHIDLMSHTNSTAEKQAIECAEIAVAYDQAFKDLYGGADEAAFMISARANNVSAFYIEEFEIDYKLLEIYETGFSEITSDFNFTPCNWTNGACVDGSILYDFYQWGEGLVEPGSGFNTNPDLATFFTGRGVTQNFGFSFTFGVCDPFGYNWVEENNGFSEARKTNLWIHEMGHTWGASHSTSNNPSNMMSLIIPTSSFINVQTVTYNVITGHKNTRTCLSSGLCDDSQPPITNNSNVFTLYPFLNDIIDQNNCTGTTVDVYNFGSYAFAIVTLNNEVNMYASYADGVFCAGIGCLETYNLETPSNTWICGDTNPPTCNDGIQNGNETGVDCGGTCPTCPATCSDGVQNGNETDVDCGGTCPTCPATCSDGIQNGNETGVDCGGTCPTCPATCSDGIQNGNETGVDCGGTCPTCPATCSDGIQNGNETGVDCGGTCPTCPATCSDGVQNGNETGVDCGGTCPTCPATCSDGIQNGNETGVDCGGTCPTCPTGNEPIIFINYPFLNNFVDYTNCNGTSIEIFDFGNYVFALVETSSGITMYSDYFDGVFCSGSSCADTYSLTNPNETWTCGTVNPTPTCNDGIQNGNETGIDCGGGVCSPCSTTGNCQPNWFISINTPYQNLYESSGDITTNGAVLINSNQQVEYNANRVRLNTAFSVQAGAQFKVRTDGCQ